LSSGPDHINVRLDAGRSVGARVYKAGASGIELPPTRRAVLVLGHGAGAGQDSRFMVDFATALASLGITTVTFNFPYTEEKRRLPDRREVLEACYRAVIETVRREVSEKVGSIFIGGKSMGGRMATHVAAADPELKLGGLVLLGYPLHPPGRPAERRDQHLPAIRRPMLFVQGSRDTFGTPEELQPVLDKLEPRPALLVVDGGDHSFKVARSRNQAEVFRSIQKVIADWISDAA
jgi:uncharacterized protein